MANPNSGHDSNHVPTVSALSSSDGTTIVPLYADPITHRLLTSVSGGSGITIGTTTITSGTDTRILYDNAGVVGEYQLTGTGKVVMDTSPTLSNPVVGTQATTDNSTLAASTAFVQNAIVALNPAVPVKIATTAAGDTSGLTYANGVSGVGATLTGANNTAITIDGHTFVTGDVGVARLLVKNDTQSPSGAFNGIYLFTALQTVGTGAIFTRATDYDTPTKINGTGAIPVITGTANALTSWLLTSSVVTVGTTALTYSEFTYGAGVVTSITGTANQITASASTGAVTLSLPSQVRINSNLIVGSDTGAVFTNFVNEFTSNTVGNQTQVLALSNYAAQAATTGVELSFAGTNVAGTKGVRIGYVQGVWEDNSSNNGSLIFGARIANSPTNVWKITGAGGHFLAITDNTYDIGATGATRPRSGHFGTSVLTPSLNTDGPALNIGTNGNNQWQITTGGHIIAFTDNTYDIGASGATRPRTGYFGTSVLSPLFNAATGFQIAGAASSGKILKANGTNFVASTETYAAPGTSGNVMTSDGTNWTSAAPAAATVTPRREISYTIDATGRYASTVINTGAFTIDTNGALIATGATQASSVKIAFKNGVSYAYTADNSLTPAAYFELGANSEGSAYQLYMGFGAPAVSGTTHTFTNNHSGIKVIRVASSNTVSATNADGSTETATAITWDPTANGGRFYVQKTTSNCKTYLVGVLVNTSSTNLQTASDQGGQASICNSNVATASSYYVGDFSISENATP